MAEEATGTRVAAIAPDLWMIEGPVVSFYGFPYPTRALIARLADGGLWVWSPVPLDKALRAEVAALGPVHHLVSPNKLHHLGLDAWHAAWPAARLWGPASLTHKRDDLPFAGALTDAPPADWADTIDQAWFRGGLLLDEVAFFHRPSCTAILGDLVQTFTESFLHHHWAAWQRPIARLWHITDAHGEAPLEIRLSFVNRAPARAALERVLAWNPERVVMAHGRWRAADGRAFLEHAFRWLRRPRPAPQRH